MFAHSVDPIKKETASEGAGYNFGFGQTNSEHDEIDKDELIVPRKV